MTAQEYETVKVEREDGVAWMILNRPEKRNAMNPQMHYEAEQVINQLSLDPDVQVVVLTGEGEAFVREWTSRNTFERWTMTPRNRSESDGPCATGSISGFECVPSPP